MAVKISTLSFLFILLLHSSTVTARRLEPVTPNTVPVLVIANTTNEIINGHLDDHKHLHQNNSILSVIIWVLETPHIALTMFHGIRNSNDRILLLSLTTGGASATTINAMFWFAGNYVSEGLKELLDLLGHTTIAYIVFSAIKELGSEYYHQGYTAPQIHASSKTALVIVAGTAMHFSKAALLSAPAMIEQEHAATFLIPGIAIAIPAILYGLNKKITISSNSVKQRLLLTAGSALLVIGTTAGVASMTTTLGEHIDFDHTFYDLAGDDEGTQLQLLHTLGLEKITVGTIISSAFYIGAIIYSLAQIRNRHQIVNNQ